MPKVKYITLRGLAVNRPAAADVWPGTLYYSTDTATTDRVSDDNTTWETYADAGDAPADATYLTATDETADLPNSRQLIAGTNIAFDDATPGERTVSASGGDGNWIPLVDGAEPPAFITDGAGVLMLVAGPS